MKKQFKDTRQPGMHLVGTIINCDQEALLHYEGLLNLLESLPSKINMRKINFKGNPVLQYCENEKNSQDFGFSGVVLLHESHFSIHTWAAFGSVDFDVFSCFSFNPKIVLDVLEWYFRGEFVNVSTVSRGNVPNEINTLINPFETNEPNIQTLQNEMLPKPNSKLIKPAKLTKKKSKLVK